ncbi:MAG: hypothetical protein K8S54_08350 [Spirochaetia bacterium]|nr:hypothetical protein [Spirochaetia bacterium]
MRFLTISNQIRIFLVLSPFVLSALFAESGQDAYNRGIDLLYKHNQPAAALESFKRANSLEGDQWSRPFMVGFTLKAYLKKFDEALPYLSRAAGLEREGEELPYKEYIQCLELVRKLDDAIAQNNLAQSKIKAAGKTPSAWFGENIGWLYFLKGDFEKAQKFSPPGSWVRNQLADRRISIDWRLKLPQLLNEWRLADQKTIRLTLPVERAFQKLTSAKFSATGAKIQTKRVTRRGNQFLEVTRLGDRWPTELRMQLTVQQTMRPIARHPAGLAAAKPGDANYAWASENNDGLFSLDDPEFIARVEQISSKGRTTGEKADLLLNYLRANYKYGEKPSSGNVKDWLAYGSGDCGYFTFIAIGMLRAIHVPVRGLYGVGPWSDPPPALPHSILEIYDASSAQWFPHDPQSESYFGVINPSYVPFTAGSPKNEAAVLAEDKVWELDTVWFFWNGSGKETISYDVRLENTVASRSMGGAPDTFHEPGRGGPPPGRKPKGP